MLTGEDFLSMRADMVAIRGDNEVSIVIRRGDDELAPQSVRVARVGRSGFGQNERGGEHRLPITVLGGIDFDVQVEDRFTSNGILYRVGFVHPNRTVAVTADAEAVE